MVSSHFANRTTSVFRCLLSAIIFTVFFIFSTFSAMAAESPNASEPLNGIKQTVKSIEENDFAKASIYFQQDKKWWTQNKQKIKNKSYDLAQKIDRQIAETSLGLATKDSEQAQAALHTLQGLIEDYRDGAYTDNQGNTKITLASYVEKLENTKKLIKQKDYGLAETQIQDLQKQWLTVEGDVVSQSQAAYDNTERDLMLLSAYIQDSETQTKTADVLTSMISTLKPFANTTYTWFDAALIPFREGLEALLIIATLLTFAKKANTKTAKNWIIGGTAVGLTTSFALGMVVAFWLSTLAFGQNNNLINGWSGVIASGMMLYVSYWLHSNADIKKWNGYVQSKSDQAISNGKMVSFALLAFLSIVREGLETVVFLIGMAGKMPQSELMAGILAGAGFLFIIAFLMLKFGVRLPLKPFFLASSGIVFYLCFKFMGSGIHSLQLAGVFPSTVREYLPSIPALSIYPSWYSFLPQLLFVIAGIVIILNNQLKRNTAKNIAA
ncbi:FTR1 family iron permease [Niallia nealsonii]|uniref:FTR1 family iron permease n=1 Tax=Niallia nealsonii TaxID=115979 RepID=UPI0038B29305